jgi:hypothetical protein
MGVVIAFKGIKGKKLNIDAYRLEILNELRKEGTTHRQILARTVTTWKHKPTFESLIGLDRRLGATVITGPTGSDKAVKLWQWADEGTKPHTIRAKNAPALSFRTGYTAKSRVGKFTSRRSRRYGPWRRTKSVRHPGTKAREWTKILTKRRKGPFTQRMIKAMQRAAKKSF